MCVICVDVFWHVLVKNDKHMLVVYRAGSANVEKPFVLERSGSEHV